jgi:hypothetical protein
VELGNCLTHKAFRGGGRRSLSEFFKNVEGLLVFLPALNTYMSYPSESGAEAKILILPKLADGDTHNPQANPGLGNVNKETILGPSSCGLYLLKSQVSPVLLEMYMNDECNSVSRHV